MVSAQTFTNQEWLQTNGLGGFASGVVSGPPSRRYHGLLCASLNPPTDRWLLGAHLIENVECCGEYLALSCEHYAHHRPEVQISPASFSAYPYACWSYGVVGNKLTKSVIMVEGENTTLVRYENQGAQPITLHLKPLLGLRNYHALRSHTEGLTLNIEPHQLQVQNDTFPSVYLSVSGGNWAVVDSWYHQIYYAEEAMRGFDSLDENYCPASLCVTLPPAGKFILRLSTQPGRPTQAPFLSADEKHQVMAKTDRWGADIARAAAQFMGTRKSTGTKTILAGYPWFTDWGRDTLISLRDFQDFLTPEESRGIIKTFLKYEQNGLIPNRFPDDSNDPIEYNTADATLWLFVAAWALQEKSPSKAFVKTIFPKLTRIIAAHIKGTEFNIGVLGNGLLSAGKEPWQLTWMDARIGDYSVTPRMGCAVEINMLWYNALKIYEAFGVELDDKKFDVEPWLSQFEKNFAAHFWNPEGGGLYDLVQGDGTIDAAIRPNQIYGVSLPFTVLSKARQKQVLQQVTDLLYTPFGLRTLSTDHPDFRLRYEGDTWSRDTAYHQGTVWPFLLREYWVAHEKIYGPKKTKAALAPELEILKNHFYNDAGIGSVSEIFDGENPRSGKGTPQQAWSVAAYWRMTKMMR